MRTIIKKINGYLFKSIVIETKVDDIVIAQQDDNECIIKLTINNNADEDLTEHLIESGRYDIELGIVREVLYIRYIKSDDVILNQDDYFEAIGLIILIPKDIPYKHVKK